MIALALPVLFAAAGLLALGTMIGTVRRYAPLAMALPNRLHTADRTETIRVTVETITVHKTGQILRPDFTGQPMVRPAPQGAFPAAA